MNRVSDDRPRMFTDEEAAAWEEYRLEDAWTAALDRWRQTKALQAAGDAQRAAFYHSRPTALRLSKLFAEAYEVAKSRHDHDASEATRKALAEAAQRCEIVSFEHPPVDEELNVEFDALDPAIKAVDAAIDALEQLEGQAERDGRTVWYRSRRGVAGDYSTSLKKYVPDSRTADPPRGRQLLFDRRGADPMVALIFAREALATVVPVAPERGKRHSRSFWQVDEILSWTDPRTFNLPLSDISKLLKELGYPERTYGMKALTRRQHDLVNSGVLQLPPPAARGRPRANVAKARERRQRRRHRKMT